jgi:hypothetical protein
MHRSEDNDIHFAAGWGIERHAFDRFPSPKHKSPVAQTSASLNIRRCPSALL